MTRKSKKKSKNIPKKTKKTVSITTVGLPDWFQNSYLHYALIFVLCTVLYANTLTHDYTQDDAIVITENEFTTKGIAGIPDILRYDTFRGFFKVEGKDKLVAGGRYRPLTLVLFAVGVEFFGQNPFVGHLMNIFWYGLTCVLLYILLRYTLILNKPTIFAVFVALTTALLFAAHPLHTEVVANIKGRDEIIALLGSLATAYFSLRAWHEKRPFFTILAGVIFFLTLFSKENAITFLGVIPLLFFVFTKANFKDIALQTLPLVIGAGIFLGIRDSIIGGGLGETTMELMNNPFVKVEGNNYVPFTFSERMGTIFYTLWKYIQLQFFPHPLTHDYYPRHIGIVRLQHPVALLGLLVHLGLLVYALLRLPKRDIVSFGVLYYLGTLFIVSNLLFPIGTNMAERLIFMPSVGFCLLVAVGLYRLAQKVSGTKQLTYSQLVPFMGVGLVLTLALGTKTILRNMAWKDNFTLFMTDVKTSANSAKLQNSVGGELITQATKNDPPNLDMIQEAVPHLQKAISIHPNYKNAHLLLGNAYYYLKQYPESIRSYHRALDIDANYADAIQNLAISYRDNKEFEKAVEQLSILGSLTNGKIDTNENIAFTYEEAGKYYGNLNQHGKALEAFEKALKYGSDKGKYRYFMGLAYSNMGNTTKAIENMEQALQATDKAENKKYILRSLADIYQTIDPTKAQMYLQQLE